MLAIALAITTWLVYAANADSSTLGRIAVGEMAVAVVLSIKVAITT
jgi:hypothetical protein